MKTQCDQCGSVLNVPETTAGKKGRCPKCKQVFRISPLEESDGEGPDLAALAGAESQAPSLIGQEGHCPSCGEGINPGDRICVACGTDLKTGRKRKTVVEQASNDNPYQAPPEDTPQAPKPRKEPRSSQGSGDLVAPATAAAGAAALGALIWIGMATFSGYEIGFLAILIGILAGQAARGAASRPGLKVGLIAAVIAIAGVGAGVYGGYYGYLHFGSGKEDLRQGYEEYKRQTEAITGGQLTLEPYDEEKALKEATFSNLWMQSIDDWIILAVFSGLGAAAAFRNGLGKTI